ncbi:hypothetical protein [Chitinasiproducens palmae]|nr:hypothetical protein [Chitinasiproducens palmae]
MQRPPAPRSSQRGLSTCVERVGNAPAFEARSVRLASLPFHPHPPTPPTASTAPAPSRSLTGKRALLLGGAVLGGVAGALAMSHWRASSIGLVHSNAPGFPDLPPTPPLAAWHVTQQASLPEPHAEQWQAGQAARPAAAARIGRDAEGAEEGTAVRSTGRTAHGSTEGSTGERIARAHRQTEARTKQRAGRAVAASNAEVAAATHSATGHPPVTMVLRDVGGAADYPLSAMDGAAQLRFFSALIGRDATPDESKRMSTILRAVDVVIAELVALLPAPPRTVLLDRLGAPLLRLIVDNPDALDPRAAEDGNIANLDKSLACLTRAIIATNLRDRQGDLIVASLKLPPHTRLSARGPVAEIGGQPWTLSLDDGTFQATRDGRTTHVRYSAETEQWRPVPSARARPPRPVKVLLPTRTQLDARIAMRLRVVARKQDVVATEGTGRLYNVTLPAVGGPIMCARVDGLLLPVRAVPDSQHYEAYDLNRPMKAGYPLRFASAEEWEFGMPSATPSDGHQPKPPRHVSSRLEQLIPDAWLITGNDTAHLSSPDSRGVMMSSQRRRYLQLGKGIAPIEAVVSHPRLYRIGPLGSDRILCTYDRDQQRFRLVPEEASAAAHTHGDAGIDRFAVTLALQQERIATCFARQSVATSHRSGFRTQERDVFPQIVTIDTALQDDVETIFCYGLDQHELAISGSYYPAARRVRDAMLDTARRVQALSAALHDPLAAPALWNRFFALIGRHNEGGSRYPTRRRFTQRLAASARWLARHVLEDCRRVWLVSLVDGDLHGLTYRHDPLERILIDVAEHCAHDDGTLECGLRVSADVPLADDRALLQRKASHLRDDADDVFHMHAFELKGSVPDTLARLTWNRFDLAEIRRLLRLTGISRKHDRFQASNLAAAFDILDERPLIRTRLLLDNPSTFASIVLTLSESAVDSQSDEAVPSAAIEHVLLSAAVAHAQWQEAS